MMRSLAINLVFIIILFVIFFFTLISIYFHFLNSSEKYYCYNLYKSLSSDIPEECKKYIPVADKIFLNYTAIDELEKAIAIYIARCWVRSGRGMKKATINCFSLEMSAKIQDNINFTRIRTYLNKYSDIDPNMVYVFPNNIEVVPIFEKKIILIVYNGSNIIVW